ASRSSRMVGSASRRRVSSPTWPSFIGTLKSTRTKTRVPRRLARSRSSRLNRRDMAAPSQHASETDDQVGEAIGVPPLVVVPGDDAQQATAVDVLQQRQVDDRRAGVADEVRGDELVVA